MVTLSVSNLELFRQYLDRMGYDTLQRDLRGSHYFADPWPHFGSFRHKLLALPNTPQTILEHLLLGIPKASALISDVFPLDVLRVLEQLGVLSSKSGHVYTDSTGLASFFGSYFWASLPPAYPTCVDLEAPIYLGADSYRLAHNVHPPRGTTVLDLCTGSGIQTILAARSAKRCVGVEISPEACWLATLNAALNGVSEIVEIREGDLFEPVKGMIFDMIYCNPPFLAVPDGIHFPLRQPQDLK